ncbi:Protein NYNRIN, partial [Mucuna pruriens]
MGKVTALARFISKAVETATPLFATLKKGGRFTWTNKCEEAFLRLKAMMATPPVLIRPRPSTPLHLYILVSDTVVSSALIQEEGGEQRPIYFTSKVLQGAERRIIVQIDLPIRQVLRKPDMAGRMVAWSVQLSEFDISFERSGHVKAQVLADFIIELTSEDRPTGNKGEWYLSVDGSTNQAGSGAGVILEGPEGVLIEQSLHFDFRASNNQAESNSKLVTGQVNNEYQTRDPQLARYKEWAIKLATDFEKFELIHVPRDQNERADLLAKLASTQRRGQLRSVIH